MLYYLYSFLLHQLVYLFQKDQERVNAEKGCDGFSVIFYAVDNYFLEARIIL